MVEDKEGKNINKCEKWIKDNHPEVIGQKLEDGTVITPRVLTQEIRNMVPSSRLADCKFLLGVTRIYFDFQSDPRNLQRTMSQLNKTLKILATSHADEYDNNFNGLTAEEINDKFKTSVSKELDSDKDELRKLKLIKNADYRIVPIDSFEEAEKYGKYVSWCVAHDENMYNNYTGGGLGRFYFCLADGFEKVPKKEGDGCPMDTYGKSMIAVGVNDDGSLNTCTCRWNHEQGANDNMMDTKQISEFFGVNFYETFKPYSQEEIWNKYVEEYQQPEDGFAQQFGCIRVLFDENSEQIVKRKYNYSPSDVNIFPMYKKLIDGKIASVIKIKYNVAFINGKFFKSENGKLVETDDFTEIEP